jgi:hypothetical protein
VGDERNGPNGNDTPEDHVRPSRSDTRGNAHEPSQPYDELIDELERQARETLRLFRESAGELGARVRQAIERASDYWDEAELPQPATSDAVTPEVEHRARLLARRWVDVDFLVDPELPDLMHVQAVEQTAAWKIELRERGESRRLDQGSEPYTGRQPDPAGPVLPVWDYSFPLLPEIQSGERRERLAGTEMLGACLACQGSGHRPCATCAGKGFLQCPVCHGRSRLPCPRCRGRGRIADPAAERRARAHKGYLQVQAERLASDASLRLADFAEKLRQEYGVPLPPSAQWAPTAPASGETLPCPDCVNGTVPCACGNGKQVCADCHGTGTGTCPACSGTGRVVRFREIVRRFDTRISTRSLPVDEPASGEHWWSDEMLRRAGGEQVWSGSVAALDGTPPADVPARVWEAARETLRAAGTELPASGPAGGVGEAERRVIARHVHVLRIPLAHVVYTYADQPFSFVAVGSRGSERFWAQSFPPRWGRVSRFLKALSRDLGLDTPGRPTRPRITETGGVHDITEFRARREHFKIQEIRIVQDEPEPPAPHQTGDDTSSERDGD